MVSFLFMSFLIKSFAPTFSLPSFHLPAQIFSDHSVFDALCLAKASPSTRYVTADNTVCRLNDILSHKNISPEKIIKSNTISLEYKKLTEAV